MLRRHVASRAPPALTPPRARALLLDLTHAVPRPSVSVGPAVPALLVWSEEAVGDPSEQGSSIPSHPIGRVIHRGQAIVRWQAANGHEDTVAITSQVRRTLAYYVASVT